MGDGTIHPECLLEKPPARVPVSARFHLHQGTIAALEPDNWRANRRFWVLGEKASQVVTDKIRLEASFSDDVNLVIRPFGGTNKVIPLTGKVAGTADLWVSSLSTEPKPNIPAHFRHFYRLMKRSIEPSTLFPTIQKCDTRNQALRFTFPNDCPFQRAIY